MKALDIFNKETNITVNELLPRVFHLEFKNQLEITSTLLRFQEYFESPKFRKKIFTIGEYIKWYSSENSGEFTYFTDWNGFNFPSEVLKSFYNGLFKKLTKREKQVLSLFKNQSNKFYIIGTHEEKKKDPSLLNHEIAHALYYTDPIYKKSVKEILSGTDLSEFYNMLARLGYHKSVFFDEAHAYLSTGYEDFIDLVDMKPYKKIGKILEKNFKETYIRKTQLPRILINEYEF